MSLSLYVDNIRHHAVLSDRSEIVGTVTGDTTWNMIRFRGRKSTQDFKFFLRLGTVCYKQRIYFKQESQHNDEIIFYREQLLHL